MYSILVCEGRFVYREYVFGMLGSEAMLFISNENR